MLCVLQVSFFILFLCLNWLCGNFFWKLFCVPVKSRHALSIRMHEDQEVNEYVLGRLQGRLARWRWQLVLFRYARWMALRDGSATMVAEKRLFGCAVLFL